MKTTHKKIDRATLIKGGGTAALATLLIGALEGQADACCFPIDLSYGDIGSLERTSERTSYRKSGTTGFTAVKIWAPKPGTSGPLPAAPWTLLFTADVAAVKGNDENGNSHGKGTKPKPLGGKIWVFVK